MKKSSAITYAMGLVLLVGCSSGGGGGNQNMNGPVDMTVVDDPDGGGDPTKDMTGMPPEDMAGMTTGDMTVTVGLPCTPGTYRCGAGLAVEICNATGTAWLYSATCTVGCTAGLCTGACTPSAKRCNGKNVETCNGTGSAWTVSETCGTFCDEARCALPSLDVGANKTLDGDQLIDGDIIIRSGATLSSPTGNLTLRTRGSITVEMGASIVVNPTGNSPDGAGSGYYSSGSYYAAGGGGYGSYGTSGQYGYGSGGSTWGSTTDVLVAPGSPGGTGGGYSMVGGRGGKGGGVLRLIAAKTITIDGQVTANGEAGGSSGSYGGGGGGSGGGILIAAQKKVTVTGSISAAGGAGGAGGSYAGGAGGQGRIKILNSGDKTVTGTINGAKTEGLIPPLSISSSSHPDQTLYYNDDSPGLSLAWDQAFMGRQGYYWGVNTAQSRPPTPANGGKVAATEMTTAAVSELTEGTNYFHIVPIDAMTNIGTIENIFKVNINTVPPTVSSTSHPSQGTWYPGVDVFFAWTFPQDDKNFKGIYYVLDRYGETQPAASMATMVPSTQKQLLRAGLANGIWVMHVVPIDQRGYLTKTAQHFRVHVGSDPGKGALLGQVVDGMGKPVVGARLTVNRGLYKTTTNSSGAYNFLTTIPVGMWEVRAVSSDGSLTETKMDSVTKVGTTTVNFTLK
mgnify:FL=1